MGLYQRLLSANAARNAALPSPSGQAISEIVRPEKRYRPVWNAATKWKQQSEIYRIATIVHACIVTRATAAADAELEAFSGDPKGQNERLGMDTIQGRLVGMPCSDLSKSLTPYALTEHLWTDLDVHGCAYWWKHRSKAGIWAETRDLRAHRISEPIWSKDKEHPVVLGWEHSEPGSRADFIPARDLIRFSRYDPADEWAGLSRVRVLANEGIISLDQSTIEYFNAYFNNGGIPSFLLTTDQTMVTLTEEDITRAEDTIREKTGRRHGVGGTGWREPIVMTGGLKAQMLGAGPEGIDLFGILSPAEARTCAIFQVPAVVVGSYVGLVQSTAYKTPTEARWQMYEQGIAPQHEANEQIITLHMRHEFGPRFFCKYNLKDVSALQERYSAQRKDHVLGYSSGLLSAAQALPSFGFRPAPGDESRYAGDAQSNAAQIGQVPMEGA